MFTRVVTFFALIVISVAGGVAIDQYLNDAQQPLAAPSSAAPVAVAQQQREPAPQAAAPAVAAPSVTAPPVEAPAPVVTAPPAETPCARRHRAAGGSAGSRGQRAARANARAIRRRADDRSAGHHRRHGAAAAAKPAEHRRRQNAGQDFVLVQATADLGKAMAIGYYPRGCLQGGVPLPVTGPTWQVMRLSRNRHWGHPELVKFLERFAPLAAKATGWNGIMIGDMAQPRGGPLPFGHMSHQIGLDVDIWFMPMPAHVLSKEEREKTSAINLVSDDWKHINPKTWSPQDIAFIKTAATQPEVERVLVNAAIKQELCRVENKSRDGWMAKVRPWYGHNDHIHVRLKCPADSPNCRKQPPVPGDDGCSAKALDYWFSDKVLHPPKPTTPAKPPRALTLADLPPACKNVLDAPAREAKASEQ